MKVGEIDYLVTVAGLQTKPWDQSNWVAVKLPSEANPNYLVPRAQDEATKSWVVYPLELSSSPVTAVEDLSIGKAVTGIVYYNMIGVASKVPHPGVNIVETRYSDGTRATTKIIR